MIVQKMSDGTYRKKMKDSSLSDFIDKAIELHTDVSKNEKYLYPGINPYVDDKQKLSRDVGTLKYILYQGIVMLRSGKTKEGVSKIKTATPVVNNILSGIKYHINFLKKNRPEAKTVKYEKSLVRFGETKKKLNSLISSSGSV